MGEAGTAADAAAIPWAMLRRWERSREITGWTFEEQVLRYCSPTRPDLASAARLEAARRRGDREEVLRVRRRRWLQALSWDVRPADFAAFRGAQSPARLAARWERSKAAALAWGRGEVADPCPGADHWDQPASRRWVRMRRVRCSPSTGNQFYASR